MMFKLDGIDRDSSLETTFYVEASSLAIAQAVAEAKGMVVVKGKQMPSKGTRRASYILLLFMVGFIAYAFYEYQRQLADYQVSQFQLRLQEITSSSPPVSVRIVK